MCRGRELSAPARFLQCFSVGSNLSPLAARLAWLAAKSWCADCSPESVCAHETHGRRPGFPGRCFVWCRTVGCRVEVRFRRAVGRRPSRLRLPTLQALDPNGPQAKAFSYASLNETVRRVHLWSCRTMTARRRTGTQLALMPVTPVFAAERRRFPRLQRGSTGQVGSVEIVFHNGLDFRFSQIATIELLHVRNMRG
jgi:hypothetical protein